MDVEAVFGLNPEQARAAKARQADVILTAGAGSGKTRTLVARYVSLLNEGLSPRQVVAITFTEKAAREMRNRVREALAQLRDLEPPGEQMQAWAEMENQMDAARIGTIHSLCAEILRAHPAEAGVDPQFEVLDEGLAAALQAQSAQEALAWAMDQPEMAPLFENIQVRSLGLLAGFALERRLDLRYRQEAGSPASNLLLEGAAAFLERPEVAQGFGLMRELAAEGVLTQDAGDKLAAQIKSLLAVWRGCLAARDQGNVIQALRELVEMKPLLGLGAGRKASQAKAALREIREIYDDQIYPWLEEPPNEAVEAAYQDMAPLLERLFEHAQEIYQEHLEARRALDFDDLEGLALELLREPAVRSLWADKVKAVLVDEFQDTNSRQREIVEALTEGRRGALFVVGDERQSIYRFRGADVTVFRRMRERMANRGGAALSLATTYRPHQELLEATECLLEPAMQAESQPPPPYWVVYTGLHADRQAPMSGLRAPYLEFILGQGRDSQAAREIAARMLAARLLALKESGRIGEWDQVALLFRASTNFPIYEDALEAAGIPYVTVAGRGFYDRPEIRDALNILQALADPWDDHAMAGLLRSPAFGLSDAALYLLRWGDGENQGQARPYYSALSDPSILDPGERALAERAYAAVNELGPLVDRLPVADLLKTVIDRGDLRAILATARSRLWRNLDKLLEDAHTSRMVNLRAFLEYLNSLREVGARESEAPVEAEGSVQLMTIHKAKGLEFNLVVIADAGYAHHPRAEAAYLLPEAGLSYDLDRRQSQPVLYCYLKQLNARQERAEEKRLLYVAATRAREKLIVSGHIGKYARGWVKELLEALEIDLKQLSAQGETRQSIPLTGGQEARLWLADEEGLEGEPGPQKAQGEGARIQEDSHLKVGSGARAVFPLYEAVESPTGAEALEVEGDLTTPETEETALWRATGRRHPTGKVIGRLVHRALQRWRLPPDQALEGLLEAEALRLGLADPDQRREAVSHARMLLARFAAHPVRSEIERADVRRHEAPYYIQAQRRTGAGRIDLLYRLGEGWRILDFKSDRLETQSDLEAAVEDYRERMLDYRRAVQSLLVEPVSSTRLCFLDYKGGIELVEV